MDLHQQHVGVLQDLPLLGIQQDLSDQVGDDFFGGIVLSGDKLAQEMQGAFLEVLLHGGAHHAQLPTGNKLRFLLHTRQDNGCKPAPPDTEEPSCDVGPTMKGTAITRDPNCLAKLPPKGEVEQGQPCSILYHRGCSEQALTGLGSGCSEPRLPAVFPCWVLRLGGRGAELRFS